MLKNRCRNNNNNNNNNKEGGLGVRRVTLLAPAFLASAAGTETLQQQLLLRSGKAGTIDTTASSISDIWSSLYSVPRPSGAVAYKQSAWDKVAVASERETLTSRLSDNVNKARLLAVTAPHSGDWLHALPLSNCGLRLDDSAIHIAVGL